MDIIKITLIQKLFVQNTQDALIRKMELNMLLTVTFLVGLKQHIMDHNCNILIFLIVEVEVEALILLLALKMELVIKLKM